MKRFLTSFPAILFAGIAFSQTPTTFDWAKKWSSYSVFDIATDNQGNVYTLSSGSTQVNFNPTGAAIMGPTAGCGAISKFDSSGNLIWVKFITKTGGTGGACEPKRLFIKGNYLYYAGEFGDGGGTYDFDVTSTSTYNITGSCNGCGIQVFVSKIDLNGNFQAFTMFGQYATVTDLYVDNSDNVYLTGGFRNGISLTGQSVVSNGDRDAFLMKLNANFTCQWVKSVGCNNAFSFDEKGVSVKVNSTGEVIFVGNFEGTVDIDPGPGNIQLTSNGSYDAFLLKLSPNGSLIDYKIIGGIDMQRFEGLEVTSNDEIILTGVFSDSVDFDLTSSQFFLYSPTFASFVVKYSPQFNLTWAKMIQGSSARTMMRDSFNRIYVSGVFGGTVDFDPNAGITQHTSGVSMNTFVVTLNGSGNYLWSGIIQGGSASPNYNSQFNEPENIYVSPGGIYISGNFQAPTDFDPGLGTFSMSSMTSPNGYQQYSTAFILKLNQCIPSSSIQTVSACGSYTAPDGQVYAQSGTYNANLLNATGCDSTVTINLTIQQPSTATIDTMACSVYTSPSGSVLSVSGQYLDTISTVAGCDSVLTINLSIASIDTTVTKNGNILTSNQSGATYQWYNCTTNAPIPGATAQSFTANATGWYAVMVTMNGCSELSSCRQVKKITTSSAGLLHTETISGSAILVYPSPTNDEITIQRETSNTEPYQIIDALGRVVSAGELIDETQKIRLVSLSSGSYTLFIGLDNEPIKIIKE
jgi:hypothetical protein